jgi:predicted transcriptional regulator
MYKIFDLMLLSQNDIRALVLITGSKESINPRALQAELGLRRETVSRLITHLVEIGLAKRRGREVVLAGTLPAEAFKKLYFSRRASPLHKILSLRRAELLAVLDRTPRSLEALARENGIPDDTLYGYLKGFLWVGVVSRSKQGKAYLLYQVMRLVPREALLIKSYETSVLFKSLRPQDAAFSSFSAYEDYGILLGLRDYYYTLLKRELSIQEVFIHSLDSAGEMQQKLFCVLFYLKNRDKLEAIDHPMMKNLKAVLQGERR